MARKINKKLGKRYKDLREKLSTFEKDYTQAMLAKELGLTKPQISNLENGKREPSLNELKAYSKYFNCPMEYLIGIKENRYYETGIVCNELGLSDKSIKTLQFMNYKPELKEGQVRVCGYGRCYDLYLKVINLLIEYADFNYIIQALHDYLFFDTPKAHFINYTKFTNEKGVECMKDDPINCVQLSDNNKIFNIAASELSESILESILISKFRALKKEILEDNLKNVFSLLEREEEKEKIKNTKYKDKREQHLKLGEVESGKYKKN